MKPPNLLSLDDRLELAPDVDVGGDAIDDPLRARGLTVTATAAPLLRMLPCTVRQWADALADQHRLDPDRAAGDALAFAAFANAALVVNVRMIGSGPLRRMALAAIGCLAIALTGIRPEGPRIPYSRTGLLGPDRRTACRIIVRRMLPPGALCAAVAVLPLAVTMLAAGLLVGPVLIAVALTVAIGPTLHELGHALVVGRTPCALVTSGLSAFVAQGPADPVVTRRAALAGPLLCLGIGTVLVITGAILGTLLAAACGVLLALQAVSLSVLSADGRNALVGR